jgi:hypothetical protein
MVYRKEENMKKFLLLICVMIMFLGVVGCPSDDPTNPLKTTNTVTSPVSSQTTDANDPSPAPTPEPMTLVLLGSGLVVLAGAGRKKFFKKDKNQ